MKGKRYIPILLLLVLPLVGLYPQRIESIEFRDQLITDILLALAEISGKSIIPDGTVTGRASYYFSDIDFEKALEVFLSTYRLYFTKENGIYYVSRIRAAYNPSRDTVSIDAEDVEVVKVLEALSAAISKTILFDALPPERITLHNRDMSPVSLLQLIVRKLRAYELETEAGYFYVRKRPPPSSTSQRGTAGRGLLEENNGLFSVDQANRPLFEILDALFLEGGREYVLLTKKNTVIERIRYGDKSFEQLLKLILEQGGASYSTVNGIYYIFDTGEKTAESRLKTTEIIALKYLRVDDLQKLFPPDMMAGRVFKIDAENNTVILNGSPEEIRPLVDFIRTVDKPLGARRFYRFDLNHIPAKEIKTLLPTRLRHIEPILIPGTNSFLMPLSELNKGMLDKYLKLVDRESEVTEIRLKYIKSEELLAHLPPAVKEEDIVQTGDPSIVFFRGSKEKYRTFEKQLSVLDQPVPQIQYQLLIIQFTEGSTLNWQNQDNTLASVSYPDSGGHAFSGDFGHLLNLNFDVFSTLGAKLSMELSLALSSNDATVLTDTTLSGISGQNIKFQDTDTFRFRELEEVEGQVKETGVTREVSTGLIVSIQGWVSGNGMITMEVDATVSKQGVDTSGSSGALPPTTEKKVTTQVRTQTGKPVIISGLFRQDKSTIVDKIPILGDIPILGLIFQKRREVQTNSEIIIYILPHIQVTEEEASDTERNLHRLYDTLFRPALQVGMR